MERMARRDFLKIGGLALAGTSLAAQEKTDSGPIKNQADTMQYRRAGRTGLMLSVITLGGTRPHMLTMEHALELGINMLHTAQGYANGKSLELVGKLAKRKRDRFYIALKVDGHPFNMDERLKTLNTDYVDFIMFAKHDPQSAQDPKMKEQFLQWKEQGKVRFLGLTSHKNLPESAEKGLATGMFDAVMPTYEVSNMASYQPAVRMAEKNDIALFPMKTLNGVPAKEMQGAQLRSVLASSKAVASIIKSAESVGELDRYVKAFQTEAAAEDDQRIREYVAANGCMACAMCGRCEKACPRGIACADLVRCIQYYHDQQGSLLDANLTYSELSTPQNGSLCDGCGRCTEACPLGIPVDRYVSRAVALLGDGGKAWV